MKTFLTDEKKQLEALDALQALIDTVEHSENLMWMFLAILWDEDVISEGVFFKWKAKPSVKDGRGGQFFSWIRKIMGKILRKAFMCILIFFLKYFLSK